MDYRLEMLLISWFLRLDRSLPYILSKIRIDKESCLDVIQFAMLPIMWVARYSSQEQNELPHDTEMWEELYENACNEAVPNMVNFVALPQFYELSVY